MTLNDTKVHTWGTTELYENQFFFNATICIIIMLVFKNHIIQVYNFLVRTIY